MSNNLWLICLILGIMDLYTLRYTVHTHFTVLGHPFNFIITTNWLNLLYQNNSMVICKASNFICDDTIKKIHLMFFFVLIYT